MGIFINIWLWLMSSLYTMASWVFRIFISLSRRQLLSEDTYNQFVTNVYVILGIVMLFIIAFALLKGMVNPDDQKAGTSSVKKLIINLVTSVAILSITPMAFNFAYDFQDAIINYNTIGGFFGYGSFGDSSDEGNNSVSTAANRIVNGVWTAFFNVDEEWCQEEGATDIASCQDLIKAEDSYDINGVEGDGTFADIISTVDQTGRFSLYDQFAEEVDDDHISFFAILTLIGGIFLLYLGLSYTLSMAKRLVKLFFYQLIAPVPILLRIVPSGKMSGMFNQWLKVTLTCYFEVFMRIFILYFCVFACVELRQASLFDINGGGWFLDLIAHAFLYMGVLMFMKNAPKIISEVTGIDSGNMKLGLKEQLSEGGLFTAGALVGGGITAGVRNFANSFEKDSKGKWHKKEGSHIFGTTLAGTVSGAARAGKAGWGAKSFKDMKGAASSGAKGATDARQKREAYRLQHEGQNIYYAKFNDKVQDISAWAMGGFESEEARIKAYNDLLTVQDKAKAATEKIMSKFSTNKDLVGMPKKFKGVDTKDAQDFTNLFNNQSLATMENTISGLKNRVINRSDYATEEDYQRAVRDHNSMVAAYDSMYQQVRKETVKKVQSMAFAFDENALNAIGLKGTDVSAITAELTNAENMLNTMGLGGKLDLKQAYAPQSESGAGYSFDTVASDVEQARNNLYADVEKKKAQRAARKGNSN